VHIDNDLAKLNPQIQLGLQSLSGRFELRQLRLYLDFDYFFIIFWDTRNY